MAQVATNVLISPSYRDLLHLFYAVMVSFCMHRA